jgi:membrane-associated phospholipid phosphatase
MTTEIIGEAVLRQCAAWSDQTLWIGFWRAINSLGSPRFFTLFLPIAFAFWRPGRSLRFASTVMGGAFITELLKALFGRARLDPVLLGAAGALEDPGLFDNEAFPSGHALMAVLIWGDLLFRRPGRGGKAVSVALMLCIGFSRLALLRHDLLDISGGYLFGAVLLALLWRSEAQLEKASHWPWRLQATLWIGGCTLALLGLQRPSMALVLGVWAGLGAASAWSAAREWPQRPPWQSLIVAFLAIVVVLGGKEILARTAHERLLPLALGYTLLGVLVAGVLPRIRLPGR